MLTIKSKVAGKGNVVLCKSPPLAPIAKARHVKAVRYDAHARQAIDLIRDARLAGHRNAREFALYLNAAKFLAPSGAPWNESSVLRVLRTLKKLGLDKGSLPHGHARKTWPIGKNKNDYSTILKKLPSFLAKKHQSATQMGAEGDRGTTAIPSKKATPSQYPLL